MTSRSQLSPNMLAGPNRILLGLVIALLLGATAIAVHFWSNRAETGSGNQRSFSSAGVESDYEQRDWAAYERERVIIKQGGEHYEPLRSIADFAGVEDPHLTTVELSDTPDMAEIIGFEVDGQAYAFCVEAMLDIDRHVVNMQFGKRSIAVSYCDLSDCSRVLSSEEPMQGSLGIGGLDMNDELVLLLDGKRFGQLSEAIPMDDVVFKRMSLGQWTKLHPETLIYSGSKDPS